MKLLIMRMEEFIFKIFLLLKWCIKKHKNELNAKNYLKLKLAVDYN